MTLCIVWRTENNVHFFSDSRLTLAPNSYADVAIKILPLRVNIFSPRLAGQRTLDHTAEMGMCFAGSAVNSLFIKESIAELLRELQYAPGHTDFSMDGIARFAFNAYTNISRKICETAIGGKGRASIVIAGFCPREKQLRTYLFETDDQNRSKFNEILTGPCEFTMIGSGKNEAQAVIPPNPSIHDFIKALQRVINDGSIPSVGGPIQYGAFRGMEFRCCGITEFDGQAVRYWRGGLDINSEDFISGLGNFIPGFTFLAAPNE